jgi:hypothetical protein
MLEREGAMKNAIVALALLLSSATSVAAVDFEEADLHPLLRVNASLSVFPLIEPSLGGRSDEVKVITRGGALISVLTRQIGFSQPFQNHILRGVGSPAAIAQLKTMLGQNQVGIQTSCLLDPNTEVNGTYEITWYGRGPRRNSFVVYYGTAGAGFPACPLEVSKIVQAIREFEDAVTADPNSEVLDSD